MKIIDISMPIHPDMPVWKNREEKRPVRTVERVIPRDAVNESNIRMNLHTGTHIDAPFHMMEKGWTAERLPLDRFITPCRVLDLTALTDGITRADLLPFDIKAGEFVIFKTRNSFDEGFRMDFIYIKADAAEYLRDIGVKGVGIDALGVERDQPGHETHLALLGHDIMVLEGLMLKEAPEGRHLLIALPLLIEGADGAPARAVLIEGGLQAG